MRLCDHHHGWTVERTRRRRDGAAQEEPPARVLHLGRVERNARVGRAPPVPQDLPGLHAQRSTRGAMDTSVVGRSMTCLPGTPPRPGVTPCTTRWPPGTRQRCPATHVGRRDGGGPSDTSSRARSTAPRTFGTRTTVATMHEKGAAGHPGSELSQSKEPLRVITPHTQVLRVLLARYAEACARLLEHDTAASRGFLRDTAHTLCVVTGTCGIKDALATADRLLATVATEQSDAAVRPDGASRDQAGQTLAV
ncbi:protein of unknown function [Streptomyces sp. Ag109_O5-10]|nr:protein of unknown function [Streptomyces sp. Ag109_O5-10]